jgi:hypothetical protein
MKDNKHDKVCIFLFIIIISTPPQPNIEMKKLKQTKSRAIVSVVENRLPCRMTLVAVSAEPVLKMNVCNCMQELLRHHSSRSRGGIPFIYAILVALVGIILGYLMKRT